MILYDTVLHYDTANLSFVQIDPIAQGSRRSTLCLCSIVVMWDLFLASTDRPSHSIDS